MDGITGSGTSIPASLTARAVATDSFSAKIKRARRRRWRSVLIFLAKEALRAGIREGIGPAGDWICGTLKRFREVLVAVKTRRKGVAV